jgi:hypothetical protein
MSALSDPIATRLSSGLRLSLEELARREGLTRAEYIPKMLQMTVAAESACRSHSEIV